MGVPISTHSVMRARPVVRRALAATASMLLLVGITTLVPVASASAASLDTSDPAAVAAAYASQYVPSTTDTIGWTGSTSGCKAGATSSQSPAVTLSAINYVRSLAGLDPVSFDPALSAKAQQAALMMSANSALSHDPPSSWNCWTQTGHDAAGASNLALGAGGGKAVGLYMSDPGTGNAEVGHRRWVLYPQATTFGTGSTSNANDLYVFGKTAAAGAFSNPDWVPWPSAGYFPEPLEPSGRWSLSTNASWKYDLSHATVSVKDADGTALKVTVDQTAQGYGNDTLVWEVAGLVKPAAGKEADYTVTVNGMKNGSQTLSHSYVVQLFNPDSVPTPPTPAPAAQNSSSLDRISHSVGCARSAVCTRPDTSVRPTSTMQQVPSSTGSTTAVSHTAATTKTSATSAARAPASSTFPTTASSGGASPDAASESPEPLGG
jgi:uncharacterized protein YkwD